MGYRRGRPGIPAAGVLIVCLCLPEARGDVYLSDLVAGGDGSGNAPPQNIGISADDGTFQTAYRKDNIFNTGDNPQAAGAASPYLDSVFILDRLPMPINSKGVAFNFQPGDPSTFIWGHILKDRTHDLQSGYLDISLGGASFRTGIGIHAASGVTFDLEAIRARLADPEEAAFFSGTLGIDRCAGNVNNYLILSDGGQVLDSFSGNYTGNLGEEVQLVIPPEARYLTLASGAAGDGIGCDHGVFADARLTRPPPVLIRRTIPAGTSPGSTITIEVDLTVVSPVDLEVREIIPRGFVASAPSNGGILLEDSPAPGRQTILWTFAGPGLDDQTLTYRLQLPDPLPRSGFLQSAAVSAGSPLPILGDRIFASGLAGFASEALVIALRQPTRGCAGAAPPEESLRLDYLSDGRSVVESTVVPAEGDPVSPDFLVSSPAAGGLATTWSRRAARPGGWFELDPCEDCLSYLAFYVENPGPARPVRIGSASDDSEEILVDGREVWIHSIERGSGGAKVQDHSPLFELGPGKHLVLAKVFQGCGVTNAALRFEDEDRNPVLLPFTVDPAGYLADTAFVRRTIPRGLEPGTAGRVVLEVGVPRPTSGATIEENVPPSFLVSEVSGGGALNGQRITWDRSGPLSDLDLSYLVTVPEGAADASFRGTAVLGGREARIGGDQSFTGGAMDADGFIKEWLVLGPFETFGLWNGDGTAGDPHAPAAAPENGDLRADYLTDGALTESSIHPFDGMRISPEFGGDGTSSGARSLELERTPRACAPEEPTWERFTSSTGTFRHNDYFGGNVDSHATYAACYLTNPGDAGREVFLAFASDDAFIALLNGVEAAAYEPPPCSAVHCGRGFGPEETVQDLRAVTLPPGESVLLVRVHDGTGASGFRLRFQEADGSPLLPPALAAATRSADHPPAVEVVRILPGGFQLGSEPFLVRLAVTTAEAQRLEIREVLPAGWLARDISDGGVLQSGGGGPAEVRWSLEAETGASLLHYRLEPPADCTRETAFCGSEFVAGGRRSAVGGDRLIRLTPPDGNDELGPFTITEIGYTDDAGGTLRRGEHGVDATGKGRGAGAGLKEDGVRFIWVAADGDFDLSARIACLDQPAASGKAGLMVRAGLEVGAVQAFFALGAPEVPGFGTLAGSFRGRPDRLCAALSLSDREVPSGPVYLRLVRAGGRLSCSRSPDGIAYSAIGGVDLGSGEGRLELPDRVLIGLAVTGGGGGPARAAFREVSGPGFNPEPPEPPRDLVAAAGDRLVELSFSPPPGGPPYQGFRIYRDGVLIGELPPSQARFTARELENGRSYCFTVRAYRPVTASGAVAESVESNPACAAPGVGPRFARGDVDSSGVLEVTDAVIVLEFLFLGQGTIPCRAAADSDDNGTLEITDPIVSLNYQFLGGPPPASPGPGLCGLDPTPDPDLGCDRGCDL